MKERLYIGLDVGRTLRGALVNESGRILRQRRVVTETADPRRFIQQLVEAIEALRPAEAGEGQVAAVGVGWAGLVDRRQGRIVVAPNLVDISDIALDEELQKQTGLLIVLDNDANAAAYGEWRAGAARDCSDIFYVTLGTGIGAGLILGGQLQRGSRGFAGEFGHVKIERDGQECACGSSGCLETLASGPNIVRRVREQLFRDPSYSMTRLAREMEGAITAERVVQAALEGDELALPVMRETGRILGATIASVINLLNVECVVIGGGLMAAGELIFEAIHEEARRSALSPAYDACRIVPAALGQDAGIIGAALLARDALNSASRQMLDVGG